MCIWKRFIRNFLNVIIIVLDSISYKCFHSRIINGRFNLLLETDKCDNCHS